MWGKFFQSRVFTAVGIAVLVLLGVALFKRLPSLRSLERESELVAKRMSEAQASKEELAARREQMQSEAYFDRQARLQLNYKKPGEEVVYVYHQGQGQESSVLAKERSNLQRWWSYLTSRD